MTGVAGTAGDLNSGDFNLQLRASLNIIARAARMLDKFSPPLGTAISTVLIFASFFSPLRTQQQETLDDVLQRVLNERFTAFSDQLLQADLSGIQAQLREFFNVYGTFSDGNLRADRSQIHILFNNNNQDTSYAFLQRMGDNFIDLSNVSNENAGPLWQSSPELMASRIISFSQVAQNRMNLCKRIGNIFARLGNVDTTNMTKEDRKRVENDRAWSEVWRNGQVVATKTLAQRYLSVLTIPPPIESRGTTVPVLRALHQIQSHADRELFEAFMRDELEMRIPGRVLQIRNLYHNQYIDVSEAACPDQTSGLNFGLGGSISFRTIGFKRNYNCPYVETTPGDAGLTN